MITTRASVSKFAEKNNLEPIVIDGIPEGFSFIEPDIEIGGIKYTGLLVAFIPLSNDKSIKSKTVEELLKSYNEKTK